jgi:serine phosphatase RsbU (regulator of sigma subunit)
MTEEFSDLVFATGQLARIDLDIGTMTWTNAGHPLPLLIRDGQVVEQLSCPPTTPWGLGHLFEPVTPPALASVALEPGDSVLLYTDGVIEAHQPGQEQFGIERLVDLVDRLASGQLEPEEIVRRLTRAVLEHQNDLLADDATVVLLRWNGPDPT